MSEADGATATLHEVVRGPGLRRVVTAAVASTLGREVSDLVVDDVTYTPGRRATVLCSVPPIEESAEATVCVVELRPSGHHQRGDDGSLLAVDGSELDTTVEVFPHDRAMPSLERAASAPVAREVLEASGHVGDEPVGAVDVLHYRPHRRAVLAYGSAGHPRTKPAAVAKIYRSLHEAEASWLRLCDARRIALSPVARRISGMEVPRPLMWRPDESMFAMEYVAESPLKPVLAASGTSAAARDGVLAASLAIAALHMGGESLSDELSTTGDHVEARQLPSEIDRVRRRVGPISSVAPWLTDRVGRIVCAVDDRAADVEHPRAPFLHGDFTPSQILIGTERIVMLDFDLAGPGDPIIDVANFTSKLRRRACRRDDDSFRDLADLAVDTYLDATDHPRSAALERCRLLEALSLARSALRIFRHQPADDRRTDPQLFIEEAERCLA